MDTASCPVVSGTPKVIRAAFTKETDFFAERGISYLDTAVTLNEPLMCKKQMFDEFGPLLGLTQDENDFAIDEAFKAVQAFEDEMERKGREILDEVSARTASRSSCSAARTTTIRASTTGCSRSSRRSAIRSCRCGHCRATSRR